MDTTRSQCVSLTLQQIENFSRKISEREKIIVSLHPHNDRGTFMFLNFLLYHFLKCCVISNRHRHCIRRTRCPRWRRPYRRLSIRQRRTHRQRRPSQPRPKPLLSRHPPQPRLQRYPKRHRHSNPMQRPPHSPTTPLCRRARIHRVLRLTSRRHQKRIRGAEDKAHRGRQKG
jgi:hypothetical protein